MDRFGGRWDQDWFDAHEQEEADMADMTVDDNHSVEIGNDERRMHVRAYNHWASLLAGRAFPSIEDIDPENIADFGSHSVLLDFTGGVEDPVIRYLGSALSEECGMDGSNVRISQVPGRSLLSRLTDHYLQIIANRAPIGFEAEFVGTRGHNTLYRGILMPFSSDGEKIDFIYGVINWKEMVDPVTQASLEGEFAAAVKAAPRPAAPATSWADGPSADFAPEQGTPEPAPEQPATPDVLELTDADMALAFDEPIFDTPAFEAPVAPAFDAVEMNGPLAEQLMLAQQSAAAVRAADVRSRAALYRALGRAYDFAHAAEAEPDTYQGLLAHAGIKAQERAPMTPVVKLVFGADYDKTRVTEFATVLDHAKREGVAVGGLGAYLDAVEGGIKGVVALARAARRAAERANPLERVRQQLMNRPPMARVPVSTEAKPGEFVILLGIATASGDIDIVGSTVDKPLTERAMRRAAA